MERAFETVAGVAFGRFQVLPHRRELLDDGLGWRTFNMLIAMIESPHRAPTGGLSKSIE